MTPTLLAHILRGISPNICAKGVIVIKDKMCVLKIQDTFLLSSICKKMSEFPMFRIKGGVKKGGGPLSQKSFELG